MFGSVVGVLIVLTVALSSIAANNTRAADGVGARVVAYANNLNIYHQAAVKYASANPAATACALDNLLALPVWYQNLGWTCSITADGVVQSYKRSGNTLTIEANQIMAAMPEQAQGRLTYGTRTASNAGYTTPVNLTRQVNGSANTTAVEFYAANDTILSAGLPAGTVFLATRVR